jgi:hypothetical protein
MTQTASEPLRRPVATPSGAAVATRFAQAGFLLLFPGFLAYHYGVSAGWFGAALGGLFGGGAALVALAASSVLLGRGALRALLDPLHLLVFGTLTYMVAWPLMGWPTIRHGALVAPITVEAVSTVVIWIAMLFIGARLPHDPHALQRLSAVGVAITLLCFGHAFYYGGFPTGPFLAFANAEEGGHSTYQGIGRSLLAIGLVAALGTRPGSAASVWILLGTVLLMLALGSRAHFFVLGISLSLHLLVLTAARHTRALGVAGVVATAVAAVAGGSVFLETRASEIIDLASSASWEGRSEATARAVEVIAEYPLAGLYGYHAWDNAGYAHNLLSAWTQYGLVGFFAIAATTACALAIAVSGFIATRARDPAWHIALHFNVVSMVLAIASEPVMSSVFPALAWGFILRAKRGCRAASAALRG